MRTFTARVKSSIREMRSSKVYSIDIKPPSSQTFSLFPNQEASQQNGRNIFKKPFTESLKKSRAAYDKKLGVSNLALNQILLESKCTHSCWYLLYAILGPLASFLLDYGAFVLWPMKNIFTYPDTW